MSLLKKGTIKKRGISKLLEAALIALIAIGVSLFLYQFMISIFMQIVILFKESKIERMSVDIANVMLSNPNFVAYNSLWRFSDRSVFEESKLNSLAHRKTGNDPSAYTDALHDVKKLDIGYPNSVTFYMVLDLEDNGCVKRGDMSQCNGWVGAFSGDISSLQFGFSSFVECLAGNINPNLDIFTSLSVNSIRCNSLSYGGIKEVQIYRSGGGLLEQGFPILIKSDSGLHVGRLYTYTIVWSWIEE